MAEVGEREKDIQNDIMRWLKMNNIFAVVIKSMGTYDEKLGRYRKPGGMYRLGVSDIVGIYNHRFLAIEVKSKRGVLSEHQKSFLHDVQINGGIAMVARSIEDVEQKLKKWA